MSTLGQTYEMQQLKMRPILLLVLLATTAAASKKEKCPPVSQEDCDSFTSEYEKYRECMEHRTKRSLGCSGDYEDDSCDYCNCDSCSYSSCESCSENRCCARCCPSSSCSTYACCHQTCRAECRSNSCRTSCKKKCQHSVKDGLDRTVMNKTVLNNTVLAGTGLNHNITTVIHLNNVINNTNLINLPISVNNTVFTNITNARRNGGSIYTKETVTSNSNDNCCITIGPRHCVPQKEYPYVRCFHMRKRACGYICTAPVVHYQKHEICDNDVNVNQPCHQQVIYVPQPQPRCAYHNAWPYVTCGNNEFPSCEGCYDHYIRREDVGRCSNFCYDDGYGVGPYYRQGPFYRPGFAHVPSCYQTGLCGFDGYEGQGEYPEYGGAGFPYAYPPSSYPYIIEDCKNCTSPFSWDSSNPNDPILTPNYSGNMGSIVWSNISDKMMNIDAQVYPDPVRSERYAEIKIQAAKESEENTTVAS